MGDFWPILAKIGSFSGIFGSAPKTPLRRAILTKNGQIWSFWGKKALGHQRGYTEGAGENPGFLGPSLKFSLCAKVANVLQLILGNLEPQPGMNLFVLSRASETPVPCGVF